MTAGASFESGTNIDIDVNVISTSQNVTFNTITASTITASTITATSDLIVNSKNVLNELTNKQDTIDIYDNIILNSMYASPFSTKTQISPAINGELRAYVLSVEDDTLGVINVGDSIDSILSTLDNKQDKITNNNYLEISDFSGLSEALENVTVNLDSSTDLTVGTISSGTITGRTGTTITAPTIAASSNLLYGTTNVATKIGQLEVNINGKHDFKNDMI